MNEERAPRETAAFARKAVLQHGVAREAIVLVGADPVAVGP